MTGLAQIRSTFLDFFRRQGHEIVASSPLVPRNDPTLMFANSGMVQFKNVFTGMEKRPYTRATTAQKCVRAGGKHNDLDNVGYTARHHTFFEMLGNFSFGDYFKPDAIEWAWTLVTGELGLAKDKLTVTVFSEDDEAHALWKKIAGLPESRIIRIPTSDNFWSMGDTGPCGPCSEIFYDHGEKVRGGPPGSAEADGDRFIEIWNLVFMQYEQVSKDERISLPRPSIDTGMGLERIAAVLQGTHDNYETDLFRALIQAIVEKTGVPAEGGARASSRVIADHLRASSFLIADGVLPSNEGRGYVLRRIMRRAMRHAELLGAREPLMHRLVPALVREMGAAYNELVRAEALIAETLYLEENRFRKTLERGLRLLEEDAAGLRQGDTFPGGTAFRLHDTYGFPLDLTQDALKPRGIAVDTAAFEAAMEAQREEARRAWKGSGDAGTETIWFEIRERFGATEFLGYDTEKAEGIIRAIVVDGKDVQSLAAGQKAAIVVNQTPFYGESGGQTGDRGAIRAVDGASFLVTDTQKRVGDVVVHIGELVRGSMKPGNAVELAVDHARRSGNRIHHSATHLLHEALRLTLGGHVAQKGSLVEPGRLRFDISHNKAMSPDEIAEVERIANDIVLQNDRVTTRLMTVDAAIAEGAMALFGEKYGDEVRVVSMGRNAHGAGRPIYSLELCGGTHVGRTGDIGLIKVVGESASAAGVRRIEALAGPAARAYLEAQDRRVQAAAAALKAPAAEIVSRIETLLDERRKLERELAEARKQLAMGGGMGGGLGGGKDGGGEGISEVNGVRLMARAVSGVSPNDMKGLVDEGKARLGSGVVALVSVNEEGRAGLVVGVTDDLTSRFSAIDLVRAGAAALGGKGGGGRPDMAQAGGPDGARAHEALAAVKAALG
ncbi:alanine--tRNA ligase [Aestuariivirga sp.]|uniref:alanine--tRNA ligase n=1 Tax=Aestuariivirga sp. TaxID=2650926 RepID=UPI0025BBA817|nr:alanine--tRNA ligase [Aestuariivirga sp.]MCA3556346.1 alanine--tRNA ligase [Aestuariivirga sp.]